MKAEQLRKSILQLAISGKLVPQDSNDEPASVLLEKIRAEKQNLIKQGKIKKEKPLSPITDDEKPFDIPDSWEWVRLGDIFNVTMGQSPNGTSVSENGIGLEFHQGKVYFGINYLEKSPQTTTEVTKIAEPNSILLCVRAPVGIVNIVDREICIGRGLCAISTFGVMSEKFMLFFIRSFQNDFIKNSTGTTFKAITNDVVKNQLFPLPPLAEQKRIVEAIEKLEPLLAEYDKLEQQKSKLDSEISDKLKKSVLQHAIQGKLVPQDGNDEPASVLLEKIRAEKQNLIKQGKIRKDKNDSAIFKGEDGKYYEKVGKEVIDITEEIPFEIPNSWEWCRFSLLCKINGGFAFKSENYTSCEKGIQVLRISDFDEYGIKNNKKVYYPYKENLKDYLLKEHDIVMCMTGGTVGKTLLIESLQEKILVNQRVADIRICKEISVKYVYFILRTKYIQEIIKDSKNSTNDNISINLIKSILIPLPPLAEQKRIVEKVEQIFAQIDKINMGI